MIYPTWKSQPQAPRGIICGTDAAQEWLLPWWWSRYTDHNAFPVTFCDFGMTEEARSWCAERGTVVIVERIAVAGIDEVDPALSRAWWSFYQYSIWEYRPIWFCKPLALLHSPYTRGIWIDLDCEILGSVAPVFEYCTADAPIGVMCDFSVSHLPRSDPEVYYNSGVIVFEHGALWIEKWAEHAIRFNHRFMGDDNVLADLIYELKVEVTQLPPIYNWRHVYGVNLNAEIIHYTGKKGKETIRSTGGMKKDFEHLFALMDRLPR